jgi:hypothetical protein
MSTVVIITRMYLGLLSLLFGLLALLLLTDPVVALSDHAIDLSITPASGLAEIRAYYFGTMALVAVIFTRGAHWNSCNGERMQGLMTATLLFGMFAGARVYSFHVDGPPNLGHSHLIWTAEVAGTAVSLMLWAAERSRGNAKENKKA